MLSPDGKNQRTSLRLTLKTSNLGSNQSQTPVAAPSPDLSSPGSSSASYRSRHHHNTRRSTAHHGISEPEFKFSTPPLPDQLGYWEQILLSKFAKLHKKRDDECANVAAETTPEPQASNTNLASDATDSTATASSAISGESAREHAIKLVLSGHLRFESQADSNRKCVSRKRSSFGRAQLSEVGSFPMEEPLEGFLKPAEPQMFSPTPPVKIKLPKVSTPTGQGTSEGNSPSKGELRKQIFVRGWHLTTNTIEKVFKDLPGYVSYNFQSERSSAIIDFDTHLNALNALKNVRGTVVDGIDLFVCLTHGSAPDTVPFEASQFEHSLAEQVSTSPTPEDSAMQQQWNVAQRRSSTATTSVVAANLPPPQQQQQQQQAETPQQSTMAPRELQTYEDVF